MGLFGFKSRTVKYPKNCRFKEVIASDEDDNILILFEPRTRRKRR